MSAITALFFNAISTLFLITSAAPLPDNASPAFGTSQLNSLLPPNLRIPPNSTRGTPLSTCNRSYWNVTWTFDIWIRNKTTVERSGLGTGLYDNANHDCNGIIWTANPTTLSVDVAQHLVTGYYVEIEVNHGEGYNGCIEEAIWQAEQKNVTCQVVQSPCPPKATSCGG